VFYFSGLTIIPILCPSSCHGAPQPLESIPWKIEHEYPHDPLAFTQGLEVWGDRYFLETTGLYGKSEVRKVERSTGQVVSQQALAPNFFGEGVTRLGREILQLTWRDGVILKWTYAEKGGFKLKGSSPWSGEGWGITQGNGSLWISNGSSQLMNVDKKSLKVIKSLQVTMSGQPTENLNELEFISGADQRKNSEKNSEKNTGKNNGKIFANIWMTTTIVRIDPKSGIIDGLMDLSPLVPKGLSQDAVANGIAWDRAKQRLYITGKLWPKVFELSL
jgi:glutaminyl-peptide cyclotransferase